MIEKNKIMLVCLVMTGQVYYKIMMDIHTKINIVIIILQVVKIGISKQQQ